jgi:hypothetical protein
MNENDEQVAFVYGVPHPLTDFDFDAVEPQPDEPVVVDMREGTVDRLVIALGAVLDWVTPSRAQPQTVLVRACVLALFIRPDALGCTNQRQLAKKLGVSRWVINRQVIEFREKFNWIAPRMHGPVARKRMKKKRNERE